jgi:hypothetical protein
MGVGYGIIIQDRQIWGLRSVEGLIYRRAETDISIVGNHAHALALQRRQIRRAIVDDHHFEIGQALRFQRA